MTVIATRNLHWLEARTGMHFTDNARGIANYVDDDIAAMVAFDRWTKNAVHIHMGADTPFAVRALIKPAFRYAFKEADKGVLVAEIPADNHKSLELAAWLGFKEKHRTSDGWSLGVDMVNLEMRREDCRWLEA